MAYNSNKGNQHMGDVQYEGDPNDVQIDFENDFIALKTNGQQRLIVSGSAITSSVLLSGSQGIIGNSLSTATTTIDATHISSSLNISASAFYGDGSNLEGVGGGGTPGGSNTQIQYNADGSFGSDAQFTWASGSNTLTVTGDISASINVSASDFYGGGANLTSLNASNVSAGTLDNARLPATISVTNITASSLVSASLFYGGGANLTTLNASNVSAGTLDNARLPANISVTNLAGAGASITALDADNINAGTLNNARLPATISVTNVTASSLVSASFLYGDGSNLTNVGTATSAAIHSSSFTASATSDILAINSSGSVITASLLAANSYDAGYRLSFKDANGFAATNNILIKPSGSENIDGSNSGILITTNYGAVEIFSNGVNSYHILSTN
tara:strand:+ start:289 stop:1461 length:1173 start_codon:yes stop_codon:yes gene_type:complete